MFRWTTLSLVIVLVLSFLPGQSVHAQTNEDCLYFGTHANGALYCITMPPPNAWNGDLVIFAHGYVSAYELLAIPWSQITFPYGNGESITIPFIVNSMGYAFATTSYSENGLAVKQGVEDILDLIEVFEAKVGIPNHTFITGASEGGLVTTLALERYPEKFTGGLAMCAQIGSFTGQVNYWGDFRVVFDYFMDTPTFDVLPGTAINIPKSLINKWDSIYVPRIGGVLAANPANTQQLFSVTQAAIDPLNPINTMGESTLGILWYNVFASNDAVVKLGGQPYDNFNRVYTGSLDDAMLNAGVKRFKAKPDALMEITNYYETSGALQKPLLTMFNQFDPIIPIWHQSIYSNKVAANNLPPGLYANFTYGTYGHCNFPLPGIIEGFRNIVLMSTGMKPPLPPFIADQP